MTTRSVPAGSALSACQSIAGSLPETSFSVRAMSRSRLMPGKTTTADFISTIWIEPPQGASSSHHLDAIILEHGIGEQLVGGFLQRGFRTRLVAAFKLDVENLALANAGDAVHAEGAERALDRLALRIKDAGFQGNGSAPLHSLCFFSRVPSSAEPTAGAADTLIAIP